jgi:hypothetical protein
MFFSSFAKFEGLQPLIGHQSNQPIALSADALGRSCSDSVQYSTLRSSSCSSRREVRHPGFAAGENPFTDPSTGPSINPHQRAACTDGGWLDAGLPRAQYLAPSERHR